MAQTRGTTCTTVAVTTASSTALARAEQRRTSGLDDAPKPKVCCTTTAEALQLARDVGSSRSLEAGIREVREDEIPCIPSGIPCHGHAPGILIRRVSARPKRLPPTPCSSQLGQKPTGDACMSDGRQLPDPEPDAGTTRPGILEAPPCLRTPERETIRMLPASRLVSMPVRDVPWMRTRSGTPCRRRRVAAGPWRRLPFRSEVRHGRQYAQFEGSGLCTGGSGGIGTVGAFFRRGGARASGVEPPSIFRGESVHGVGIGYVRTEWQLTTSSPPSGRLGSVTFRG